jgi:hypothetical protein
MIAWWWLIVAVFAGANAGVILMALLCAAGRADEQSEMVQRTRDRVHSQKS